MDALNLENLSENDKKGILTLLGITEGRLNAQEELPSMCNSENIRLLIESLRKIVNLSENLQVQKSKGKQTTLDNWLVKPGNISAPKSKVGQSQSMTQSCESSNACNEPEVSSHTEPVSQNSCVDIDSVDSISKERINDDSTISSKKSGINQDVSEEAELIDLSRTAENNEIINETYNLRSKRKASEQPTVSKRGKSNRKRLKITGIQKEDQVITNCNNISNQAIYFDDSNNKLLFKENSECDKFSELRSKKYNRRTKKKNPELPQSVKINDIVEQNESDSQIAQTLTNSKQPLSSLTSPSQSNYEAYCLLNRKCCEIGINIEDILKNKSIQTLFNDHKNVNDDAVVFIGSFETNTGETLPVIHLAPSKTILLKKLNELKK